MYSNKILNFQESTTILYTFPKKVWKPIEGTTHTHIYIYIEEMKESRYYNGLYPESTTILNACIKYLETY